MTGGWNRGGRRFGWEGLCVPLAATLSLAIFFRVDLASRFSLLLGDRFDGVIETALLEHWFNAFRGISHWSQPLFFFPAGQTLGYNDGYFLFGVFYSMTRAIGCDPFLSAELTDIALKLCGFAGFLLFSRRCLGLRAWSAALGACVFTTANNSYVGGNHVQLFAVGFAPLLATLLHEFVVSLRARTEARAAGYGVGSALFLACWLMTAFYTAYFFLIFSLLFGIVLAASFRPEAWRLVTVEMRASWRAVACSAAALAISLLPFLGLYLGTASETGMHPFGETFGYLGSPLDLLNLSGHSLFYAGLQHRLAPLMSGGSEQATGFTPVLLLVFAAASIDAVRRWTAPRRRLVACFAISTVLLWLLTIHVGRFTMWRVVYDVLPGASAVRVISRVQILLQWPLTAVAVAGVERAANAAFTRRKAAQRLTLLLATALIAVVLVAEQINRAQMHRIDRRTELAWLHSISRPPAACRVFYVSKGRPRDPDYGQPLTDLVEHGISAMLVAEWFGVPTINGFATFMPLGWNLLSIADPGYRSRVSDYTRRFGLRGVCALDLRSGRWAPDPP